MNLLIVNNDNLKDEDINEKIFRPRALILNSKNEILLGYCNKTYQFPGGYLEKGETLKEGLKREVKEETGIVLEDYEINNPFVKIRYYNKDYPRNNVNRMTEFSYFCVHTNKKIDLLNTYYDSWEKENDFQLVYVSLDKLEELLKNSMGDNYLNEMIYNDMIKVVNLYRNDETVK